MNRTESNRRLLAGSCLMVAASLALAQPGPPPSGHGIGNTKTQQLQERADMFAFLLWQMGVEGYAPQAKSK